MTAAKKRRGVDKESDLVGRNTAAWGHTLPWPWLHFRSFLPHLYLLVFLLLILPLIPSLCLHASDQYEICNSCLLVKHIRYTPVQCFAHRQSWDSLEVLVLSRGADLRGVALSQLVQASGVLELELSLSAEELLQVLQQLQPRLWLLLQTTELLHKLVTDLCKSERETAVRIHTASDGVVLHSGPLCTLSHTAVGQHFTHNPSAVDWTKHRKREEQTCEDTVQLAQPLIKEQSHHNWIKLDVKVHLSAVCVSACVSGGGGGCEGMGGGLNAGIANVHMTCMSVYCSRQHGKYKIGQLLKMHCAERALSEVCLQKKKNNRHAFNYKIAVVLCLWGLETLCFYSLRTRKNVWFKSWKHVF